MNPSSHSLRSGTYVIHSVQGPKHESLIMIAGPSAIGKCPLVITQNDQMYKWIVTYSPHEKNYTIKAADGGYYVVTTRNCVGLSQTSQSFEISPCKNTGYYEIKTTGKTTDAGGVFQCEGDGRQVQVAAGGGRQKGVYPTPNDDTSTFWDFAECSPYTLSSATNTYFESDPEGKLLRRFGLSNYFTWDQLWQGIDDLNANAQGGAFYKLFLLGRHGHNEHNIKELLGKDYDGFDAALTQKGCVQAGLIRDVWDSARCEHPGIGLPQLSLCSPMRRALATNTITCSRELSVEDPPTPKMTTLVVENCRERMYKDDSEKRHSGDWIRKMFPNFQTEIMGVDRLWNPKLEESFPHFRERARDILDRVFASENASVKFVSITAHHEWSAMIMEVLGQPGAMDRFRLEEGGVLPVIVQYTPPVTTRGQLQ